MTSIADPVIRLRDYADEIREDLPYTAEAIRALCFEVEALRKQDKELREYVELLRARVEK